MSAPEEHDAGQPLLAGLARNAAVQLLARMVGVIAQAIGLLLVARDLGPAQYGRFALVSTLALMATAVADWGLLLAGARAAAQDTRSASALLRAALTLRLCFGLGAAIVVVALSFVGSGDHEVHLAAAVAGTSFVAGAWLAVGHIRAQLDLRMDRVALAGVAGSLASTLWLLGVLAADGGIVALAGSFVAAGITSSAVVLALSGRRVPVRPGWNRPLMRRLLADSHPIAAGGLLVTVYFYVDAILLARLSTTEQLGLYDAAYRFVQIGVLVPGVIVGSVYTIAARLAIEDRASMAVFVRELGSILALLIPLPLIGLATAPEALMTLLYGEDYAAGAAPLAILAAAVALLLCSGVIGPLLVTLGRERTTLKLSIVATVVNVATNVLLIPSFGARGAAFATLLTEVVVVAVALLIMRRELPELRMDGGHLAKVTCAAAAGAAVVVGLPGHVIARLAAGVTVYVVVLLATGGLSKRHLDITRSTPAQAVG